eukprot:s1172_g7.t1
MCTLRHPFEAKNQAALLIKILRGQFAPIDTKYSEELGDLRELIDGCMQRELVKRTKLTELLAKPISRPILCNDVLESYGLNEVKSLAVARKAEKRAPVATGRATPQIPKHQPPRTRVRLDPRANARREESKTVLVAPKAKTEIRPAVRSPCNRCNRAGSERLKAEVAELPDVVMAAARPSRNVPSVQQLLSMDNSPIKRLLQRRSSPAYQEPPAEEIDEELEGATFPKLAQGGVPLLLCQQGNEGNVELTQRSAFEEIAVSVARGLRGTTIGYGSNFDQTMIGRFKVADALHIPSTDTLEDAPEGEEEREEAMTMKIDTVLKFDELQPVLDGPDDIPEELTAVPEAKVDATTVPASAALPDPAAQVERLSAQISRLYMDVVRDLDASARKVWDELYVLFQALHGKEKMRIDMTDEDQSEIEAFIFEHLPTESTELIWKVYKVLYLEQERDRFRKLLESPEETKLCRFCFQL